MSFLIKRALRSLFLPSGIILFLAIFLFEQKWIVIPAAPVNFFYDAVFVAATLLAWRFHSTRVLFCVILLLLGHLALSFFAHESVGQGHIAFEATALLLPVDFILLTFFPERGSEGRVLGWFLLLVFLESVFVASVARPDQIAPSFLHFVIIKPHHARLTQPAMLVLIAAISFLMVRLVQFHRPTESGMLWCLVATWIGLEYGATGKMGSAYFGVAALMLASAIVENSYSLAYHDELTGLSSRRAFNEAVLRLKAPYAIAVVDIDHFKNINDSYGHDTGDQVLRLVASRIARVGGGGQPYRIGGEEFTIVFSGKPAAQVADYLELLRLNIENTAFRVRSGEERRKTPRNSERRNKTGRRMVRQSATSSILQVTVSIGLSECQPKFNVAEVVQQADKALYRAKHSGRNRLEVAASAPRKFSRRTSKAERT